MVLRGRSEGSEGYAGIEMTEKDRELARRRFEAYVAMTKGKDPVPPFEEILPHLPLNGGTKLACGHTRFHHLQTEGCQNRALVRCQAPMNGGRVCALAQDHRRKRHASEESLATEREYKRRRASLV